MERTLFMKQKENIVIYEYFAKRTEVKPNLKIEEIKEDAEFKKLQKAEQAERKEAETFLSEKYDLLKRIKFKEEADVNQPAPKKVQPTRKPKQKSNTRLYCFPRSLF